MDLNAIPWDIGIVFFVAGCIAGGVIFSIILIPSRRRNEETVEELGKMEREFSAYREDVNQHFNKTAELVNTMTESYRSVYQHLADGAQNLCDEQLSKPAVQFTEPKLVEQLDESAVTATETLAKSETEESEVEKETHEGKENEISIDSTEKAPAPKSKEQVENAPSSSVELSESLKEPASDTQSTSSDEASEEQPIEVHKDADADLKLDEFSALHSKEAPEQQSREKTT